MSTSNNAPKTSENASVLYLHGEFGERPALVVIGPKHAHAVHSTAENGLYVEKLSLEDAAKGRPVPHKDGVYPANEWAAKQIALTTRKTAQRAFTKQAMSILQSVAGDTPVPTHAPDDTASEPKGERARSTKGNVVASICAELNLQPKAARRTLRKAGLRAPYTDEAKVRAALTSKTSKAPKATKPAADAPAAKAKPAKAKRVAKAAAADASAKTPVAADGAPLDPSLSVAARRAAARRPSPAVKIEVQAQA